MKSANLKLAVLLSVAAGVCGGVYAQAQQAAKPRWQMPTVTLVQDAGSQEFREKRRSWPKQKPSRNRSRVSPAIRPCRKAYRRESMMRHGAPRHT